MIAKPFARVENPCHIKLHINVDFKNLGLGLWLHVSDLRSGLRSIHPMHALAGDGWRWDASVPVRGASEASRGLIALSASSISSGIQTPWRRMSIGEGPRDIAKILAQDPDALEAPGFAAVGADGVRRIIGASRSMAITSAPIPGCCAGTRSFWPTPGSTR